MITNSGQPGLQQQKNSSINQNPTSLFNPIYSFANPQQQTSMNAQGTAGHQAYQHGGSQQYVLVSSTQTTNQRSTPMQNHIFGTSNFSQIQGGNATINYQPETAYIINGISSQTQTHPVPTFYNPTPQNIVNGHERGVTFPPSQQILVDQAQILYQVESQRSDLSSATQQQLPSLIGVQDTGAKFIQFQTAANLNLQKQNHYPSQQIICSALNTGNSFVYLDNANFCNARLNTAQNQVFINSGGQLNQMFPHQSNFFPSNNQTYVIPYKQPTQSTVNIQPSITLPPLNQLNPIANPSAQQHGCITNVNQPATTTSHHSYNAQYIVDGGSLGTGQGNQTIYLVMPHASQQQNQIFGAPDFCVPQQQQHGKNYITQDQQINIDSQKFEQSSKTQGIHPTQLNLVQNTANPQQIQNQECDRSGLSVLSINQITNQNKLLLDNQNIIHACTSVNQAQLFKNTQLVQINCANARLPIYQSPSVESFINHNRPQTASQNSQSVQVRADLREESGSLMQI